MFALIIQQNDLSELVILPARIDVTGIDVDTFFDFWLTGTADRKRKTMLPSRSIADKRVSIMLAVQESTSMR